jgi:hypothetical protein
MNQMQSVLEDTPVVQSSTEQPRLHVQSQRCPHCDESLIAQEIPKEYRECYLGFDSDGVDEHGRRKYKPKPDDGRFLFYSHLICVSSLWHDRILAYQCPFCDKVDVILGLERQWDEYNWKLKELAV